MRETGLRKTDCDPRALGVQSPKVAPEILWSSQCSLYLGDSVDHVISCDQRAMSHDSHMTYKGREKGVHLFIGCNAGFQDTASFSWWVWHVVSAPYLIPPLGYLPIAS